MMEIGWIPWLVAFSTFRPSSRHVPIVIASAVSASLEGIGARNPKFLQIRSVARREQQPEAALKLQATMDDNGGSVVVRSRERSCDETKCRNVLEGYNEFVPGYGGYACWTLLDSRNVTVPDTGDVDTSSEHLPNDGSDYGDDSVGSMNETMASGTESESNITYAAACADGFQSILVEDTITMEHRSAKYTWYTCCISVSDNEHDRRGEAAKKTIGCLHDAELADPPPLPRRQCSDSSCMIQGDCWGDSFLEPMMCDGSTEFRYPRKTGADASIWGVWTSQYLCCCSPGADGSPVLKNALPLELLRVFLSPVNFAACLLVMYGVLSNERTRGNSYNLYLLFLALPDAIYSCFNTVAGALALNGVQTKMHWALGFQSFYGTSNMCLNAVIAVQVYRLLVDSYHRRKTGPPTVRRACQHAAAVFIWAAAIATFQAVLFSSLFSLTIDGILAVWITLNLISVVPPFACLAYVCIRVWWVGLLPRSGRTRALGLYYQRVVLVYVVFWVPSMVAFALSTSGVWAGSKHFEGFIIVLLLVMLQGIVSSAVALSKPDIKEATWTFLRCRCVGNNESKEEVIEASDPTRQWWSFKNFSLKFDAQRAGNVSTLHVTSLECKEGT